MKKTILLLSTTLTLFANQTLWTDIDGDGKQDKIELVKHKSSVTVRCKLTAQNRVYKSKPFPYTITETSLSKKKRGFLLTVSQHRQEDTYQFRYEPKVKKIRLIGLNTLSQTGNIEHSTSAIGSLNLLTQKFVGEYEYYSINTKEYKKLPTFYTRFSTQKTYLNSDISALYEKIIKRTHSYENKACKQYEKSSKSMAYFLKRKFPYYKVIKNTKEDVNNISMNILVLEKKKKITVALVKSMKHGFRLMSKNSHIFTQKEGIDIVKKGRYLSFESQIPKGTEISTFEISTFRYSPKYKRWYLYKYGVENSGKTIKLKTKKDFGVVRFENFRKNL